ncbi:hypothetical protein EE612_056202 [Oryza sativa]|nr:hypothetical protein EE612_056202 [Oryza sativa]
MAAAAEAEEEVRQEVEAVASVYGDDCRVVRGFPPHLVVHVRPRTADDSSQQVSARRPSSTGEPLRSIRIPPDFGVPFVDSVDRSVGDGGGGALLPPNPSSQIGGGGRRGLVWLPEPLCFVVDVVYYSLHPQKLDIFHI